MDYLNNFSLLLASLFSMALTPQPAEAQQIPNCLNLYNGGISCSTSELFDVEKTVQNPKDGSFVQILEPNQTKIMPGNTMIFRITITNTSDRTLEDIAITDQFSDTLTFTNAQKGTFDKDARQLRYTLESLPEGKSETFDLQTTIKAEGDLPNVTGPLCAINVVTARSGNEEESANVQFCIEKNQATNSSSNPPPNFPGGSNSPASNNQVTQTTNTTKGGQTVHTAPNQGKTPDTGPELLALIGLIPAGLGGYFLRRRSNALTQN
jgi:uncharacterized repeat protein (TIGR01451 family)